MHVNLQIEFEFHSIGTTFRKDVLLCLVRSVVAFICVFQLILLLVEIKEYGYEH